MTWTPFPTDMKCKGDMIALTKFAGALTEMHHCEGKRMVVVDRRDDRTGWKINVIYDCECETAIFLSELAEALSTFDVQFGENTVRADMNGVRFDIAAFHIEDSPYPKEDLWLT